MRTVADVGYVDLVIPRATPNFQDLIKPVQTQVLMRDGNPLAVIGTNGQVVSVGAGNWAAGPNGLGPMFVGSGVYQYFKLTDIGVGVIPLPGVVGVGSGGVVSVGAGNVVSVGAGNVVSVGAGNVVSVGAGNVVSVGSGNIEIFDRLGRVVGVGSGNIAQGEIGKVVSVGAGNVVSVGAGNVVSVGAGNLSACNEATLAPFLTVKLLDSAAAARLAQIKDNVEFAAGQYTENLQFAGFGGAKLGAASSKRRSARPVTVWKAKTKITRFGEKKLVLKPTRKGLKLLRRIAKTNARLRKRHRRPVKLRMTIHSKFKPRHGKTVKVTKRGTTKPLRRR
jgi:hypothetical protein